MSQAARIRLSDIDAALAMKAGRERQRFNEDRTAIRPKWGAPKVGEASTALNILGCRGEIALARYLEMPWDGRIGQHWRADVAENLEVRATGYVGGHMILTPEDKDDHPYILAIDGIDSVNLVGWLFGREGKLDFFWREVRTREGSRYFIPQNYLRPMHTLRIVLERA